MSAGQPEGFYARLGSTETFIHSELSREQMFDLLAENVRRTEATNPQVVALYRRAANRLLAELANEFPDDDPATVGAAVMYAVSRTGGLLAGGYPMEIVFNGLSMAGAMHAGRLPADTS